MKTFGWSLQIQHAARLTDISNVDAIIADEQ